MGTIIDLSKHRGQKDALDGPAFIRKAIQDGRLLDVWCFSGGYDGDDEEAPCNWSGCPLALGAQWLVMLEINPDLSQGPLVAIRIQDIAAVQIGSVRDRVVTRLWQAHGLPRPVVETEVATDAHSLLARVREEGGLCAFDVDVEFLPEDHRLGTVTFDGEDDEGNTVTLTTDRADLIEGDDAVLTLIGHVLDVTDDGVFFQCLSEGGYWADHGIWLPLAGLTAITWRDPYVQRLAAGSDARPEVRPDRRLQLV